MKKLGVKLMGIAMSLTLGLGTVGFNTTEVSAQEEKTFGIIFKNTGNPLGERVMDGFETAMDELGYSTIRKAPDQPTAEQQINMIQELIDQGVSGIAISANDPDALQPVLQMAKDQGIAIVSYDSATNEASRHLHIQQTSIEGIGEYLSESVYDLTGGEGEFAILSATSTATNQNAWIAAMEEYMANDSKFESLTLVKTAYGDDLRDKSTSEAEALLQSYPDLKLIMSPATVGLAAAAKVVYDQGKSDQIKVTGLGLPSEMADYIDLGVTPYMYLWSPIDQGYMTGYALAAIADGELTGAVGETFEAGDLGEKEIIEAADGGTESILDVPFRFDPENIDEWKELF